MSSKPKPGILSMLGPGILVAATGVGAGDLATGAFAGSNVGVAILWAVVAGAVMKFVLNEGLARWQLATGTTLLEGTVGKLGKLAGWLFLPYLILWSYLVAMALMGACGATAHAIFQVFEEAAHDKVMYGALHSALAVVLIMLGGYRLFEKLMSVCIAAMFLIVVATAIALQPDWSEVLSGIVWPGVPDANGNGSTAAEWNWTVGLIGGVGGTVTVLCYGYWIREEGRTDPEQMNSCRLDLGIGYIMTALFGLAMVIVGSFVEVEGGGAGLLINLSSQLEQALGPVAKWAFLIGGWCAVFSSLMGVWQSVPYLFADLLDLLLDHSERQTNEVPKFDLNTPTYQYCLHAIATLPLIGLWLIEFQRVQLIYAICGAAFVPMLAIALLLLCTRTKWMGSAMVNRWWTNLTLAAMLLFFGFILGQKVWAAVQAVVGNA